MGDKVYYNFPVVVAGFDGLDATEIGLVQGALEGAIVASKVVSANSSGYVPHRRHVVEDGASVTLTALQSGALCVFDKTDGALFTLPAPAIGLTFDFVVDTASSSVGQKIITDAGTTFIKGTVLQMTLADAANVADTADGTTHRSVNFNGTTTGGVVGTRVRLTCRTATVWEIEGLTLASGSVATSFATS
jgi:hypothetical protein